MTVSCKTGAETTMTTGRRGYAFIHALQRAELVLLSAAADVLCFIAERHERQRVDEVLQPSESSNTQHRDSYYHRQHTLVPH